MMNTLDKSDKYMLLSRLLEDCKYYCKTGSEKHLWAENVEEHIRVMNSIWEGFGENEKPEWTSKDAIDKYAKEMRQVKEHFRVNTIDEKLKSLNGDGAFQIVRVRDNSDTLTSLVVKGLPKDVLEKVKQTILENKIDLNEYPKFKRNDFTNTGLWLEYMKDDNTMTVTYCFDDHMELCTLEKEKYPEIVRDIEECLEKDAYIEEISEEQDEMEMEL